MRSPSRHLSPLALALQLGLAAGFGLATLPLQAQSEVRQFDVPAGPLGEALNRYASQAGVAISFDAGQVRGLRSPGLRGSFGVAEGFARLLQGSGLQALAGEDGYVLSPVDQSAVELAPTAINGQQTESAWGPVKGYVAKRSATATKTDTALRETPQAITVVTRDEMDDLGAQSLQDALSYAAGVRSEPYGLDLRSDYAVVRGSSAVYYRDGLRNNIGFNGGRLDPYALERVEVLRGPSSMLFGQGSTAGVINTVSKRPLAQAQHEVGTVLGNHDRKQVQFDTTGPLTDDGQWLYRVVALGRDGDTQVDHVPDDRALFAPSLTWLPNDDTSITLQAFWQKNNSGSTQSFLPWSGTVLSNPNGHVPTNRFVSEPGFDENDTEMLNLGWLIEHCLDDQWTFRQNLRYLHYTLDLQQLYPNIYGATPDSTDPFLDPQKRVVPRAIWAQYLTTRGWQSDQNFEGLFSHGRFEHRLLVGFDYSRYRQEQSTFFGFGEPLDLYDPVYTGVADFEPFDSPDLVQRQTGFYLQDQITFDRNWILVAGLRYDHAESKSDGQPRDNDYELTKRIGLMYAADNGLSPYLSYSESFTPVAGIDPVTNSHYKPMRGKQWEAGLKYEPPGRDMMFSAAVYDLKEENRLVPGGPLNQLQLSTSHNQGVELEARGSITSQLEIIANYNYIDLYRGLEGTPKHQASVWSKYSFAVAGIPGFSTGVGVRYMSDFKDHSTAPSSVPPGGSRFDTPTTPSLTLVDAMAAFEQGGWRYAVNVNNVEDKTYTSICYARGDCFYGARRTITGSVTYRW